MTATDLPARDLRNARRHLRPRLPVSALIGGGVMVFWFVVAILGPWITPYAPGEIVDTDVLSDMSQQFLLGTDYLGRDILSRILSGARYTVGIALVATLVASMAGTLLGLLAAVAGGWTDRIMSRVLDAVISIPSLMFGLVAVAALGSSLPILVAIVAMIYMPGAYRIARAAGVNVNALDFVQVARARGEGSAYVVWGEVLPNIVRPMLTDFGLRFVYAVLLVSGLSFLGLGIQPPAADWGSLVRENITGLSYGAPAVLMPALAIATLTVGVNLFIDGAFGRRA